MEVLKPYDGMVLGIAQLQTRMVPNELDLLQSYEQHILDYWSMTPFAEKGIMFVNIVEFYSIDETVPFVDNQGNIGGTSLFNQLSPFAHERCMASLVDGRPVSGDSFSIYPLPDAIV